MSRPVILDLFCGAGGAAMGYHQAGFEVVGVDIKPQPRYPFRFVQGDALDVLAGWDLMPNFAAIHASPPCQAYSSSQVLHGRSHPELVEPTRRALQRTGLPWVMENVEGAPLDGALTLCGTEFGLSVRCRDGKVRELRRHRLFESSAFMMGAGGCHHERPAISVFGNGGPRVNPRPDCRASYEGPIAERRAVMGIDWMDRNEMSQAIPPAYTRFIGEQLLAHLSSAVTR